ncbi:TPA: PIG-L family deacetylase [Burkholderia vietnamiensis]|uniref:PIG-L deacetylase family protein n=1 Tax=Burkholderia vietnamiensis TaxID=60552 RepID=UPI00159122F3|nr:PIG-L family deacetylase [Burkholderia vietnamiensis]MBR7912134.1 PIG-L family deacetylase [Burkholderia vietnamiensis]MBR8013649.1 PIG-L family deacetylase [Burkholderia vietnamiensis]HDR9040631.1 PIG-L family deacetylase [Burkholderia vietnamiensis]HDR9066189.1 PIG-L family deacetylase [Burkholderia vietnamiensis]HDR9185050.1 PIG-L family deacetylase [Burkholderia vietnamiensis]
MTAPTRWLVISPHLDDAVFSCGQAIAQAPGSVVVTVFAGIPARDTAAPPWDRRAGFRSADEAVRARRDEDRRALALLDARPVWLDFFDDQYGAPAATDEIAARLTDTLDAHPGYGVLAPAGLFHRDHLQVQQAALSVLHDLHAAGDTSRAWRFYEDAPYRRIDGLMSKRVSEWRERGWFARPVAAPAGDRSDSAAAKAAAVDAYQSQIALFEPHMRADLREPETYWQLECDSTSG